MGDQVANAIKAALALMDDEREECEEVNPEEGRRNALTYTKLQEAWLWRVHGWRLEAGE